MIRARALARDVRVVEEPAFRPQVSGAVLARVDALWREQKAARGGALFDGRLFSVSHASEREIRGWFSDYRWWVAQRCDASLRDALRVRPLGVTGLVRAGDATLFGRRAERVLMNPGGWELAPSGGVEPSARDASGDLSLVAQLLSEAREELGLDTSRAERAAPFALIEDEGTGVLDAFVSVELTLGALGRAPLLERAGGADYAELAWVLSADLSAWVAARSDSLDPTSAAALEVGGLLAR
jgi:hypothetical protein